tara:strand:- start:229 stop:1188 length:960 start_codon:yes stop_codon:yes gene_type:complete
MNSVNNLISIVVPIYNESENITLLINEIFDVMGKHKLDFELIIVNDGSVDNTINVLETISLEKQLIVINLRKNYGQTAALAAGFDNSNGEIIVTLDGDLQNDPNDIPNLLTKINEGYDLICGWRFERKDKLINRRIPSKIANRLIGKVTGIFLHDYGCSLKAFKREIIKDIKLYGELHRFLPVLANIEGAKIREIKVNHRKRKYGYSKYGIDRTFRVLMDLLTVWFMNKFLTRPMYVFGFIGIISIISSFIISSYLVVLKFLGENIGNRPLLMFALILGIAGVQLFSFGLLGELLMRTYHESQNRPIYRVRNIIQNTNN